MAEQVFPRAEIILLECDECHHRFYHVSGDPENREEPGICPKCGHYEAEYGNWVVVNAMPVKIFPGGKIEYSGEEYVLVKKAALEEHSKEIKALGQYLPLDELKFKA